MVCHLAARCGSGYEHLSVTHSYLKEELKRWKQEMNQVYVEKVEQCLRNALDFVGIEENNYVFRFPDLLNHHENSFATMGFIHRMPWSMHVNYENSDSGFAGVLVFTVTVQYNKSQND